MTFAAVSIQAPMPAAATLAERILWTLEQEQRPLGVYEIARRLALATGRTHHGNSIYRVLDTLLSEGKVLPVVSARAWMLNRHSDAGTTLILLCEACGIASQAAAEALDSILDPLLGERRFEPRQRHLEILGRCRKCREQSDG